MTGAQHKVVGIGVGIAASYAFIKTTNDTTAAIVAVGSAIGCWWPDMDHDRTKLGRKRKVLTNLTSKMASIVVLGGIVGSIALILLMMFGIRDYGIELNLLYISTGGLILLAIASKLIKNSKTFRWATKHRGLMHTLIPPALMSTALYISDYPLYRYFVIGLIVGYISHIFSDMLTVEGCPVLFPISKNNIRFLKLRTKDKSCTRAAWTVAILSCVISYLVF